MRTNYNRTVRTPYGAVGSYTRTSGTTFLSTPVARSQRLFSSPLATGGCSSCGGRRR